jgi:glucokinase
MMKWLIGVDLGGTQLRVIRTDHRGKIHAQERVPTAAADGPTAVVEQIEALINAVTSAIDRAAITGVGVGAPGPVDPVAGVVLETPNLQGWRNVPLRALLEERITLPVTIGNDANAAALGEWLFGSGQGLHHFVYVTISTGIGGGVIMHDQLLLGRNGGANEIGHMTIQRDGPVCGCGNVGCWEALASGTALARAATLALNRGRDSLIPQLADAEPIKAQHVAAAARRADPLAQRLIAQAGELIGIGMVNLLHIYAPERIAVGGGMAKDWDLFAPHVRRIVVEDAMPPYRTTPIEPARLGGNVGVLGAAALVTQHTGLAAQRDRP